MDMIFRGRAMRLFQAPQQRATMSSQDLKTRLESQFSRMNCQIFSTGFSSGDLDGSGSKVMLLGTTSFADMSYCLVKHQYRVGAGVDGRADLGQVRGHRRRVAPRHDQRGALALLRADRAEDVRARGALVVRGAWSCSTPARHALGHHVFLRRLCHPRACFF